MVDTSHGLGVVVSTLGVVEVTCSVVVGGSVGGTVVTLSGVVPEEDLLLHVAFTVSKAVTHNSHNS